MKIKQTVEISVTAQELLDEIKSRCHHFKDDIKVEDGEKVYSYERVCWNEYDWVEITSLHKKDSILNEYNNLVIIKDFFNSLKKHSDKDVKI